MSATKFTAWEVRTIASEIIAGRGTHCEFVRVWAQLVMCASVTNEMLLHTSSTRIIDYYHLEGYIKPLDKVKP